jgi:hypothetical protein
MIMNIRGLTLIALLTAYLSIPAPALSSQWLWAHGNSGHVNTATTVTFSRNGLIIRDLYIPVSLDDQPSPGYAYFAVPSIGGPWVVRHLKVIVGFDPPPPPPAPQWRPGYVTQITVNNGNDLVQTFIGQWGGGSYQEISLDLDSPAAFSKGLGIELKLEGIGPLTSDYMRANITVIGVGAEFLQNDTTAAINLLLNN